MHALTVIYDIYKISAHSASRLVKFVHLLCREGPPFFLCPCKDIGTIVARCCVYWIYDCSLATGGINSLLSQYRFPIFYEDRRMRFTRWKSSRTTASWVYDAPVYRTNKSDRVYVECDSKAFRNDISLQFKAVDNAYTHIGKVSELCSLRLIYINSPRRKFPAHFISKNFIRWRIPLEINQREK